MFLPNLDPNARLDLAEYRGVVVVREQRGRPRFANGEHWRTIGTFSLQHRLYVVASLRVQPTRWCRGLASGLPRRLNKRFLSIHGFRFSGKPTNTAHSLNGGCVSFVTVAVLCTGKQHPADNVR